MAWRRWSGLGFTSPAADASLPFRGICFLSAGLSADARFPEGGWAWRVRRTMLHRLMVERARTLGVDLLWRTPVTGISADGVQARRPHRCARGGSLVRMARIRASGAGQDLDRGPQPRLPLCVPAALSRSHPGPTTWNCIGAIACQGYATAVTDEQVCVALASHDPNCGWRKVCRPCRDCRRA